jgi:hypothetical protein
MRMYKIYDPVSKLYSAGGYYGWTKNGKSWSETGLKAHIGLVKRKYKTRLKHYTTCEIHEFESEPVVLEIASYLQD